MSELRKARRNLGSSFKLSGVSEGYCRICGKYDRLTKDHVPPKCCGNTDSLWVSNSDRVFKIPSKTGLNARTICRDCNSFLGSSYDLELSLLCKEIKRIHSSKLILPPIVQIDIDPHNILKCLIGHLLSACIDTDKFDEIISKPLDDDYYHDYRQYFLFNDDSFFKKYIVYYWYYPFPTTKIYSFLGGSFDICNSNDFFMGSLLKFNPLAIFIQKITNPLYNMNITSFMLDKYSKSLPLNILQKIPHNFPEEPTSKGVIFLNSANVILAEKNKN